MSDDFWAGYISGAVGIVVGNPFDVRKVRLQAIPGPSRPLTVEPTLSRQHLPSLSFWRPTSAVLSNPFPSISTFGAYFQTKSSLVTGTAAPILGCGALNAILFVAYNRTEEALNRSFSNASPPSLGETHGFTTGSNLWTTWLAGAAGGLATWGISTPTELIKCRAQLATVTYSAAAPSSSYRIAQHIIRTEGIRGLYHGGVVTALRDSIGYGFYFWAYELSGRLMTSFLAPQQPIPSSSSSSTSTAFSTQEILKALVCGGIAGVITWASVFPLDVIKTRVQGQVPTCVVSDPAAMAPLLGTGTPKRKGALQLAREAYIEGGTRVFFRGLTVCSVRAFVVNAVQWLVYEWIMRELRHRDGGRRKESQP